MIVLSKDCNFWFVRIRQWFDICALGGGLLQIQIELDKINIFAFALCGTETETTIPEIFTLIERF